MMKTFGIRSAQDIILNLSILAEIYKSAQSVIFGQHINKPADIRTWAVYGKFY